MDFFDQQKRARRQTRRLIWLFGSAVLAAVVVNYLILAACLQPFLKPLPHNPHRYGFVFTFFEVLGEVLMNPLQFLQWLWDTRRAAAPPAVKRNILMACAQTVAADNQVTAREVELLRAIADSLDCPVPPFVQAMATDPLSAGN